MAILYNLEITVCTLAILLIVAIAIRHSSANLSMDRILFSRMLKLNCFLVISDFLLQLIKGKLFLGSIILMNIMDMIDIEGITLLSYIWIIYVFYRLGKKNSKLETILWAAPIVIATVCLLTNPFTHMMFYVDEMNMYHRKAGIFIQWIASWIYTYGGAIIAVRALIKAKNKLEKKNALPLIYFVIFPALGSLLQTFAYGLSATKLFIALGMIMVYTITTGNEVSVDALTGLNNRGEMEKFVMNYTDMTKGRTLSLTMIDMNDFKKINDTLGHSVGDEALKEAADVLRKSCKCITQRLFICRYGGDEFMLIGVDMTEAEVARLENELRDNVELVNKSKNLTYRLSFSIGSEKMFCKNFQDFEILMKMSDEKMYEDKKHYKERKANQISVTM